MWSEVKTAGEGDVMDIGNEMDANDVMKSKT